jgi:hypothetical protein
VKLLRFAAFVALCAALSPVFPQHKVAMRNMYERLLLVVPMVGAGTPEDPRRPMFAPVPPGPGAPPSSTGIVAFAFQESDDGQYAVVEMVARDRAAFREILTSNRADVKVFQKGKDNKDDIVREFRKHRKDFDFTRFGVSIP